MTEQDLKYQDLKREYETLKKENGRLRVSNSLLEKEVQQYRKAEEQGLLLKLPCKVGTPVWTIMCGMTGKNPTLFRLEFELSMLKYWGISVFLTREEAEAKLKELQNEKRQHE